MRNLLLLFIPLLFSMCSNEITDKDEYEAQIIVTSNTPINAGIGSNTVLWNILSVIGSDSDGRLIMLSWYGSAETTDFTSWESDVYIVSDGNFTLSAGFVNQGDYECKDITVELIIDGKSFDKRTATLGTDDMGAPCGNEISLSYNLILP